MSMINNYMGLLGCLLLWVAIPHMLLRTPRYPRKLLIIATMVMIVIGLTPINDLIVIAYLRGVTHDLSITSMILLALFIATAYSGKTWLVEKERATLYFTLLVAAVFIYPAGLGLGYWDSYATGYGNSWLYGVLLLLTLWLYKQGFLLFVVILLSGITGYLVNLLSSSNLWDYLIDPLLIIYIVIQLIIIGIKKRSKPELNS